LFTYYFTVEKKPLKTFKRFATVKRAKRFFYWQVERGFVFESGLGG